MPKAIISNRIYLDVTPELAKELIAKLTYKIPKKYTGKSKMVTYEVVKTYKVISSTIMSIPQGRTDLIPEGYEVVDKRVTNEVPFPNPAFELREDQEQVVSTIDKTCIINAKVGWGKTFTALHLARRLGQKTLVITHTTALRDQWIEEIEKLFNMPVGIIGSGKFDHDHAITVGNVQSVTKFTSELSKEFGTIILDEMHHVTASTFSDIIDSSYAKYRIGLSGTIVRTDGKHVVFKDYFGTELHQPALSGTMTPSVQIFRTGRMLLPGATWVEKVNDLLYDPDYQEFIAAIAIAAILKGHKVLILADRTEFLERVGELIGDECVCITGKVNDFDERKRLLEQILTGEKSAIAGSRQIFTEGISVNALSYLINASPTKNPITLEQSIGRIQRMFPGKLDPVVADIAFTGADGRSQLRARLDFYAREGWKVVEI